MGQSGNTSDQAIVLWLDMLGYKTWLLHQEDLAAAETALVTAMTYAFESLRDDKGDALTSLGLSSLLISDTIIIWTARFDIESFTALLVMYHLLSSMLSKIGLPIRGALSKGTIRCRTTSPKILIGDAIVRCAVLEPKINAFAVAVDDSLMEYIRALPDEETVRYVAMLHAGTWVNKDGASHVVLKWMTASVPYGILAAYRRLTSRLKQEDFTVLPELHAFVPKFLNSRELFETVLPNDPFLLRVREPWEAAMQQAEYLLRDLEAALSTK